MILNCFIELARDRWRLIWVWAGFWPRQSSAKVWFMILSLGLECCVCIADQPPCSVLSYLDSIVRWLHNECFSFLSFRILSCSNTLRLREVKRPSNNVEIVYRIALQSGHRQSSRVPFRQIKSAQWDCAEAGLPFTLSRSLGNVEELIEQQIHSKTFTQTCLASEAEGARWNGKEYGVT